VLKARETYEIMRAEDVGWAANKIVLGKHSGRNAFRTRLDEIGISFDTEDELNKAFANFKDLADRKHEIYDEDLHALVSDTAYLNNEYCKLVSLKANSETGKSPYAEITLSVNGSEETAKATGGGPVDATFCAIEEIVASDAQLQLYSVNNITTGTDSQGEVTVRLQKSGRIVNGHVADTDIVMASAKAYLHALNKLVNPDERAHPQHHV
jgi:2-isopropylmalate synthase